MGRVGRPTTRPVEQSKDAWEERFQQLLGRSFGYCEARTPKCIAPGGLLLGMDRRRVSIQHRRARGMGGTSDPAAHELGSLLLVCGDGVSACHGWIEVDERDEALRRGLWVKHTIEEAADVPVIFGTGRRVLLHPTMPTYLPHSEPLDMETYLAWAGSPC